MAHSGPQPHLRLAQNRFAAELRHWRELRRLPKKQLANQMGYDPSYVSHIEGCNLHPTEGFARRADAVLGAGGSIWQRWREFAAARVRPASATPLALFSSPAEPAAEPGQLLVEQDQAVLEYDGGSYHLRMAKRLRNASDSVVTRFLIRIAVDRYPGQADRSNRHYRSNPLTLPELDLRAFCGDEGRAEPMAWQAKHDRDSFKELWLLFENAQGKFPLYPGEATWIRYGYTVGADKWGHWFQRAVRLPTLRLTVQLRFPLALQPVVWGTETSLALGELPLPTPIRRRDEGEWARFDWATDQPLPQARYRLEWRFRAPAPARPER
jgi:hypothetical protein